MIKKTIYIAFTTQHHISYVDKQQLYEILFHMYLQTPDIFAFLSGKYFKVVDIIV